MPITRRRVLAGSLLAASAGTLGYGSLLRLDRRAMRRHAGRLVTVPLAVDVGIEYATRDAADTADESLDRHADAMADDGASLRSEAWIRARLRDRIRRDFAAGNVMSIGGWRLSRTELRLCALAAREHARATGAWGVFGPSPGRESGDRDMRVHWTAPLARVRVVPNAGVWECRMRAGGPVPQRVTLTMEGRVVDRRELIAADWLTIRYPVRDGAMNAFELTMVSEPAWRPVGDFRTLGIALDRLWTGVERGNDHAGGSDKGAR